MKGSKQGDQGFSLSQILSALYNTSNNGMVLNSFIGVCVLYIINSIAYPRYHADTGTD